MLFEYIFLTAALVFLAWIISAKLIETSVGKVIATTIITAVCSLGLWTCIEVGTDYSKARQFNARKQAIEITLQSDYLTDEMKIAYAKEISEFNQDLLKYQSKVGCWWNIPFLNQQCLEIEPIK